MDRIIVKSNTDMQRVIDWVEKLNGNAVVLPFQSAEIEFQDELITLRYDGKKYPIVSFELYFQNENSGKSVKIASWLSNLETGEIDNLHIKVDDPVRKAQISMVLMSDNTIGKCINKFKDLMLFASYYREEIERTKNVRRTTENKSCGSKRKMARKRHLTIRSYTVSNTMLNELPAPKREWCGYKSSFTVRGHYRKLKTGKIIWVRPYTKVGNETKKQDKEYIL